MGVGVLSGRSWVWRGGIMSNEAISIGVNSVPRPGFWSGNLTLVNLKLQTSKLLVPESCGRNVHVTLLLFAPRRKHLKADRAAPIVIHLTYPCLEYSRIVCYCRCPLILLANPFGCLSCLKTPYYWTKIRLSYKCQKLIKTYW